MTGKDFMNRVANNKEDFLQIFLDLLAKSGASFYKAKSGQPRTKTAWPASGRKIYPIFYV